MSRGTVTVNITITIVRRHRADAAQTMFDAANTVIGIARGLFCSVTPAGSTERRSAKLARKGRVRFVRGVAFSIDVACS